VLELQEIVPRILTDSTGRPLASAQKKVDSIVAGLEAGDTSANTIRAYEDLIKEMEERQKEYVSRRDKAPAAAAPLKKDEGGSTGNIDWLNAYPVKK
jgi:hypothetical protein